MNLMYLKTLVTFVVLHNLLCTANSNLSEKYPLYRLNKMKRNGISSLNEDRRSSLAHNYLSQQKKKKAKKKKKKKNKRKKKQKKKKLKKKKKPVKSKFLCMHLNRTCSISKLYSFSCWH